MLGGMACSHNAENKGDDVLATVNGKSLYLEDVTFSIPKGTSANDSALMAQKYIRDWVIDKMMMEEAQKSLENTDRIEEMVDDYRNSLYVFDYQSAKMRDELNSSVSEEQIRAYYQEHQSTLILTESLLKGFMISAPDNCPDLNRLKKLMNKKEMDEVDSLCVRDGLSPFYFNEDWTPVAEIKRHGFFSLQPNASYTANKLVSVKLDQNEILMYVEACIPAGHLQPEEFAHDYIKRILLDSRKKAFVDSLRQSFYDQAVLDGCVNK